MSPTSFTIASSPPTQQFRSLHYVYVDAPNCLITTPSSSSCRLIALVCDATPPVPLQRRTLPHHDLRTSLVKLPISHLT